MNYIIEETDDFRPLTYLFNESGLEVDIEEEPSEGVLKMWRIDEADTGRLLAACTIQYTCGCYVLENLAVREDCRKSGFGRMLLELAENEMTSRGAKSIWICAKVPEYYTQFGYRVVDSARAPEFSHCQNCPQFGTTCFPSIVCKDIP